MPALFRFRRGPFFLLFRLGCDKRGLKRGFAKLSFQLIDPFLSPLAFRRARLLSDHLIIIDDGGAIILLFVVKLRDFHRADRLLALEQLQICLRLRRFLAVWIAKQEILKCGLRFGRGGYVLCPGSRSRKPDVPDLILRVGSNWLIRKFIDHSLVGL